MSSRDALRKLSRKFPAPPELGAALDACGKHSDRGAAIMSAAIADNMLELVIRTYLHGNEPDMIGQLFKDRGPLSDFHSKILIARSFGLIYHNLGKELDRVKAIRNVFAHAPTDVTFESPQITEHVSEFIMLKAMKAVPQTGERINFPTKNAYLLMVRIVCILLSHRNKEIGGEELLRG